MRSIFRNNIVKILRDKFFFREKNSMSFHKIKIIPMYSSLNILFIKNIFSNNEKESENEYEHENNTFLCDNHY